MRNFNLTFCFLLFNALSSFSQDTILKFNGESIQAKITEINTTEIKYKKFDFQDGPLYILDKSEIKMIRYSNGLKEEFERVNRPETVVTTNVPDSKIYPYGPFYKLKGEVINEKILSDVLLETRDKQIMGLVAQGKEAQRMQYIGFVAFPIGMAGFISAVIATNNNSSTTNPSPTSSLLAFSAVCFVGTITFPVISGVYKQKRTNCYRYAIKIYNEKF